MVTLASFLPRAVMVPIIWHACRQALRLGASGGSVGGGSFVTKSLIFLGIPSLFELSDDLFGYDTAEIWINDASLLHQMVEEMETAARSGRIGGPAPTVSGNLPSHLDIPLAMVGNRGPRLFTPVRRKAAVRRLAARPRPRPRG